MDGCRRRRRSPAITLVLVGTLAGCGRPEQQRDVYTSLGDCSKDWSDPAQCEPVRDGRFSNSYFYGPGYCGACYPSGRPRPSQQALDAVAAGAASRGFSSGRASHGFGSSSSSVSRGGFGASGRASSGG